MLTWLESLRLAQRSLNCALWQHGCLPHLLGLLEILRNYDFYFSETKCRNGTIYVCCRLHWSTAVLVPGYLQLIVYEFDALNSNMPLDFVYQLKLLRYNILVKYTLHYFQ